MLPPILVELKASSGEFMAKMGAARAEVAKLGTQSSAHMQKFAAAGRAALLGISGAAIGIGVVSVKAASDFQSAMELIHTQAGASQVEVDKMSKAVLNLAGKTATAPTELAAGLFHLESAGFRGAKALEALKVAAEGAKVGHANLEDVTNALNATLVSGIKGAQNMQQAMGMLNATVGAGDMRMQDLADAMGTGILVQAKAFNTSLVDVSAALATFGDNNIRGADAATQLRLAMQFISKPASTADDALKKIGLTSKQLKVDMGEGGLGKAITDLKDHFDQAGVKGAAVGQLLLDAFGKKAGTGIGILISQYARFQSKQEEVHAGSTRFGADFAATQQTMAYKLDQLKASAEALAVKIGTALIPILERVAVVVSNVVAWFEKHRTIAAALGITVGVLVTALTGLYVVTKTVSLVTDAAALATRLFGTAAVTTAGETGALAAEQRSLGLATGTARIGLLGLVGPLGTVAAAAVYANSITRNENAKTQQDFINYAATGKKALGDLEARYATLTAGVQQQSGIQRTVTEKMIGMLRTAIDQAKALQGPATQAGEAIGVGLTGGIVNGLRSQVAAAMNAGAYVTSQVIGAMRKAAEAHSPSRKTLALGRDIAQGLIDGFTGMASAIRKAIGDTTMNELNAMHDRVKKAIDKMIAQVDTAKAKLKADQASRTQMVQGIVGQLTGSATLSMQPGDNSGVIAGLQQQLTAAQNTPALQLQAQLQNQLGSAQQQLYAAQFSASPDQTAIADLNKQISSLTDELGRVSAAAAPDTQHVADLQAQIAAAQNAIGNIGVNQQSSLAKLQTLKTDILTLKSQGLNSEDLQQLTQMSVDQAIASAQQILSGQAGTIQQLNATQKQIDAAAQATASAVGNAVWGNQIAKDTKHLKEMLAEQKRTNARLEHLADRIGNAVAANLHTPGFAKVVRDEMTKLGKTGTNVVVVV